MKPAIIGLQGPLLLAEEAAMLRARPPAGVILFRRNVRDPSQLAALIGTLRHVLPPENVLMVDQEGGRVARLQPPHWREHPPAAALGRLFAADPACGLRAAWLNGALIGFDCAAAGFDVVAAPVLDLAVPGANLVIGDRALASDPRAVAALGGVVAAGLLAAGVQPVAKHAPGHGRAQVDSHLTLPRVEADGIEDDLLPFAFNADLPWAMTAHILYPAMDPELPATLSKAVIGGVIREAIGFRGLLVTDDLAMGAVAGEPAELACRALAAGCDIALYGLGDFAPTAALLYACPEMTADTAERLAAARKLAADRRQTLDPGPLAAERDRLLA